jgi:mannose-6-phosphate isomerase-like protein (cupin superfamily)
MRRTILAGVGTAILCVGAIAQQSGPMQMMKSESGAVIKGFVASIENLTNDNSNFRHVLYTGKNLQLVLMALKPGEEIGEEVHPSTDQFFRIEKGKGEVWINGEPTKIKDGDAVLVPAGARHNIVTQEASRCGSILSMLHPNTKTEPCRPQKRMLKRRKSISTERRPNKAAGKFAESSLQ